MPYKLDNQNVVEIYGTNYYMSKNTKGYLQDNCRFILYALNIMKGKATDADIFLLAKTLVEAKKL